jgi:hypothetical protein
MYFVGASDAPWRLMICRTLHETLPVYLMVFASGQREGGAQSVHRPNCAFHFQIRMFRCWNDCYSRILPELFRSLRRRKREHRFLISGSRRRTKLEKSACEKRFSLKRVSIASRFQHLCQLIIHQSSFILDFPILNSNRPHRTPPSTISKHRFPSSESSGHLPGIRSFTHHKDQHLIKHHAFPDSIRQDSPQHSQTTLRTL